MPLPSTTVEFVVTCSTNTVEGAGTIESAKGVGVYSVVSTGTSLSISSYFLGLCAEAVIEIPSSSCDSPRILYSFISSVFVSSSRLRAQIVSC